MLKLVTKTLVTAALVATSAIASADVTLAQIGTCSAMLDHAADVYHRQDNPDFEQYFRAASVKLSDRAVAQGLSGTVLNDYLANVSKNAYDQHWLSNRQADLRFCIKIAKE